MKLTSNPLSKAVLVSLMSVLALTACTTPAETTPGGSASTVPVEAEETPDAELTDAQKAASAVIIYSEALKAKDSETICDTLDPQVISIATTSLAEIESAEEQECIPTFDSLLAQTEDAGSTISDDLDVNTLAERAEDGPVEGYYSFPESVVVEGSSAKIFVKEIDGAWKITFDPAEAEAVKQIEESAK